MGVQVWLISRSGVDCEQCCPGVLEQNSRALPGTKGEFEVRYASGHKVTMRHLPEGTLLRARAGFSLIELIVVLSIVGVLIVAMGFEFVGWRDKFNAEGDIKAMYANLSNARSKAIQTKNVLFVNIPAADLSRYRVFIDNAPTLDGDGYLDTSSDGEFMDETLSFFINSQIRHFGFTKSGLIFNGSGVLQSAVYIRIVNLYDDGSQGSPGSDYDCLELVSTRINLGLFDEDTDECVTK